MAMTAPIEPVQLIIVVSFLLLLDFTVVGLRLWGRHIKRKPLELNDYMILTGLVSLPPSFCDFISRMTYNTS